MSGRKARVLELEREVAALRDELWEQWLGNHYENCRSEWPHPGKDCYCPPPTVLGGSQ